MDLRDEQRLVDKSKLIVNHAALICNYAQEKGLDKKEWLKEYLHFEQNNHRIMQGNSGLAHDKDCMPIKDIGRFRQCYAPNYISAVKAMRNVSGAELEENKNAIKKAKLGNQICLGRYLEQWFDADDKLEMESYTEECESILKDVDKIISGSKTFFNDVYKILGISVYETEKHASDYNEILNTTVETYVNNLKNSIIPAVEEFSNCIMLLDEDLVQTKSVLTGLSNNTGTIKTDMTKIKGILDDFSKKGKIPTYNSTIESIDTVTGKIQVALNNLDKWKLIPANLITTDSSLVCRCGGTLTFYDNGQSYDDMCDRIVQATEDLVAFMEKECNNWYNGWVEQQVDKSDFEYYLFRENELKNSKQAIRRMKDLQEMTNINPEMKSIDDARQGIHLEYWSHAYFEEGESFATGLLSIISLLLGEKGQFISYGLIIYKYSKEENKNKPLTFDNAVDVMDILQPLHNLKEYESASKLYGAVSAVNSLLYTSNDTWTEEVRITFFTDFYVIIGSQKINEYGTKNGNSKFEIIKYEDYMNNIKSDGIKWKIDGIEGEEYDTYVVTP